MAGLLYGAGLRLMECLRLRVKDIDFGFGQLVVRDGKGAKDRVTMLPQSLIEPLRDHLVRVRRASSNRWDAMCCAIHLRRICCRAVMTSARCRNCWDTPTYRRP